jgi:hypothetical protein
MPPRPDRAFTEAARRRGRAPPGWPGPCSTCECMKTADLTSAARAPVVLGAGESLIVRAG